MYYANSMIAEEEMFKVVKTGKKTAKKSWKRMITKPTFVGPDFTRSVPAKMPPKNFLPT